MDTALKIATAIYNNINAGLKQVTNESISFEQLEEHVIAERSRILKQLELSGRLEYRSLVQSVNCIPVDCESISLCCGIETFDNKLHFKIPKLATLVGSPLRFIGLTDRSMEFRYTIGGTWKNQMGGKFTKHLPYVWINAEMTDGFIFNPPTDDISVISIDAVFEDPRQVGEYACCPDTVDVAIPQWMASEIITRLTGEYASNYFKFNYRPNDQTGH